MEFFVCYVKACRHLIKLGIPVNCDGVGLLVTRMRKVNARNTGFIRGVLRGVRYAKSLRVLFLH
jgi:hypothetical protein